jgi:hypothetical protein
VEHVLADESKHAVPFFRRQQANRAHLLFLPCRVFFVVILFEIPKLLFGESVLLVRFVFYALSSSFCFVLKLLYFVQKGLVLCHLLSHSAHPRNLFTQSVYSPVELLPNLRVGCNLRAKSSHLVVELLPNPGVSPYSEYPLNFILVAEVHVVDCITQLLCIDRVRLLSRG